MAAWTGLELGTGVEFGHVAVVAAAAADAADAHQRCRIDDGHQSGHPVDAGLDPRQPRQLDGPRYDFISSN